MTIANIYGILRFYLMSDKPKGSFVTGSSKNSYNHSRELPLRVRLYRDLWENGILYSVLLLLTTFCSILYSFTTAIGAEDSLMQVITTIGWPQLVHICILGLKNHSIPVIYLLEPPKYPEREVFSTNLGSSQLRFEKNVVQSEA